MSLCTPDQPSQQTSTHMLPYSWLLHCWGRNGSCCSDGFNSVQLAGNLIYPYKVEHASFPPRGGWSFVTGSEWRGQGTGVVGEIRARKRQKRDWTDFTDLVTGLIPYMERSNGRWVPMEAQMPCKRENTQRGEQHRRKVKGNCYLFNAAASPQRLFFFL